MLLESRVESGFGGCPRVHSCTACCLFRQAHCMALGPDLSGIVMSGLEYEMHSSATRARHPQVRGLYKKRGFSGVIIPEFFYSRVYTIRFVG